MSEVTQAAPKPKLDALKLGRRSVQGALDDQVELAAGNRKYPAEITA